MRLGPFTSKAELAKIDADLVVIERDRRMRCATPDGARDWSLARERLSRLRHDLNLRSGGYAPVTSEESARLDASPQSPCLPPRKLS